MWDGQHNPPRFPHVLKHGIRYAPKAAALRRHHHVLQSAELINCRSAFHGRMPFPRDEHVAFDKEELEPKLRGHTIHGEKTKVTDTLFQLFGHSEVAPVSRIAMRVCGAA